MSSEEYARSYVNVKCFSLLLLLFFLFPQALKTLSDGELVAGTHRYFLANFDKTKDLCTLW